MGIKILELETISTASERPFHSIALVLFLLPGLSPGPRWGGRRRFAVSLADLCKNILGAVDRGSDAPWVPRANAQIGERICVEE